MSDPTDEERAHRLGQKEAELRRRMAEMAGSVAATEEKVADTFEQVAKHRSPPDAERLRAKARDARGYAAKQRDRAANYDVHGRHDGQADEPG